ncbi:MAG: hypothetical protein AAFQ21_12195 [Pseudomonadota bacterium]
MSAVAVPNHGPNELARHCVGVGLETRAERPISQVVTTLTL